MTKTPKRTEATIRRLTREIDEIDKFFYKSNEKRDRALYAGMLERKRDDIVRSAVIQIHTGIEDLLDQHITYVLIGSTLRRPIHNHSSRALHSLITGGGSIGFNKKLALALALRVITPKIRDRLLVLNTLRNKCSHNWLLRVPVRHGKRPAQKKPPLLQYEGYDLHTVAVLKDFAKEFGDIYVKLFNKYLDFA